MAMCENWYFVFSVSRRGSSSSLLLYAIRVPRSLITPTNLMYGLIEEMLLQILLYTILSNCFWSKNMIF